MFGFFNSNKTKLDEQSQSLALEMHRNSLEFNLLTLRSTLTATHGNTYETISCISSLFYCISDNMDRLRLTKVKVNGHELLCPWYLVRNGSKLRLVKQP